MSLRRLAQANNAATAASSPRSSNSSASASPSTPVRGTPPTTPRTRLVYPISPVTSPSRSASTPFDWEAVRAHKPPPYASPLGGKRVRALRRGSDQIPSTPPKRVIRKKGFVEKVSSIPSTIAFEISLFPHNVPLPTPKKSAWLLAGAMHLMHLCVRVSQVRKVPDSDLGWEDMYREGEGESWFDWTVPLTILLVSASLLNALYLFTRTRLYHLNLASEPVTSPHARFVHRPRSPSPERAPPRVSLLSHLWRALVISVRFLLNLSPPKDKQTAGIRTERVQQLEVWSPGELEMELFSMYSPVHAWLWMATTSANWMLMSCIMVLVSVQLRALTRSFEALLKDKAIISAEVMHEYDEKFVYPRINPIRKDAAVMTHQAEMVGYDDSD